jgi:ribonuclease HI
MFVYTDGACVNNGKPDAKAGMGIYFGDNDPRNVSKQVMGKQSNNTAELGAFIELYSIIKEEIESGEDVTVFSDSVYAIRCVGEYGRKCEMAFWSKDIPNKELVKQAYNLYKNKSNVKFSYIAAHTGKKDEHSIGNDHADHLAYSSIGGKVPKKDKIYLNVPYSEKENAKQYGAMWDAKKKKWFVFDMVPELELYM